MKKIINSNVFIAINISLMIILLFAWNERWTRSPQFSSGSIKYYYLEDHWTNNTWELKYGDYGEYGRHFYGMQTRLPHVEDDTIFWLLRKALTVGWCIVFSSSLFFSIYGLISRNKKSPLS
ncbi:MAG: hypothetical protein K0S80_5170 [Neobacillus sp.]|nr:hypothetical protein [Neobacillus sp.]